MSDLNYLGTFFDQDLSFESNVDQIIRKANSRLHLLRQLSAFNVSSEILKNVYRSLIESVLMFNCTVWFGNLTGKRKNRLTSIVHQAEKVIGVKLYSLQDLYTKACGRKAVKIVADPEHPLFPQFKLLKSGRRYDVPPAKKNLFKKSFLPNAVSILNGVSYVY